MSSGRLLHIEDQTCPACPMCKSMGPWPDRGKLVVPLMAWHRYERLWDIVSRWANDWNSVHEEQFKQWKASAKCHACRLICGMRIWLGWPWPGFTIKGWTETIYSGLVERLVYAVNSARTEEYLWVVDMVGIVTDWLQCSPCNMESTSSSLPESLSRDGSYEGTLNKPFTKYNSVMSICGV